MSMLRQSGLELLEALLEKTQLGRIGELAALEQARDQDLGRLELVHVLEDEDLHLQCPGRHARAARVALERLGVAPRERQVFQAVLGEQRRVREPARSEER